MTFHFRKSKGCLLFPCNVSRGATLKCKRKTISNLTLRRSFLANYILKSEKCTNGNLCIFGKAGGVCHHQIEYIEVNFWKPKGNFSSIFIFIAILIQNTKSNLKSCTNCIYRNVRTIYFHAKISRRPVLKIKKKQFKSDLIVTFKQTWFGNQKVVKMEDSCIWIFVKTGGVCHPQYIAGYFWKEKNVFWNFSFHHDFYPNIKLKVWTWKT